MGHYEGDHQDDDRSNFLGTNQPSLLYFWHVVDEYGLLPSTLNILSTEQAANSESIPETAGVSPHKKRKKNDTKKREDIFAQSLNNISIAEHNISIAELAHQLTVHEETMAKFQVEMLKHDEGSDTRKYFEFMHDKVEKRCIRLEKKLNSLENFSD